MASSVGSILRRLAIEDFHFVEIEAKKRVLPEDLKDLRKYLLSRKGVRHQKAAMFFDQFLDTPKMDVFRSGASLRLRYKGNGSRVYLQYKGPGFTQHGLLYRSEFSTGRLKDVLMEESHHDIVHFTNTSVPELFASHVPTDMTCAMLRHLGRGVISRLSVGPIICVYQKDKFEMKLRDKTFLEPSLDRVFAFHINHGGLHPLSTFCEYENEIKASPKDPAAKLDHIEDLLDFDAALTERFNLRREPLDKYHRCASFFLPLKHPMRA